MSKQFLPRVNTTDDNEDDSDSSGLDALRRYVPLIVWAVVILVLLAIPLKIISYGYLPPDDALRHAAKAVSGKPWPEILVVGSAFKFDPNFGWHWLLQHIYSWNHCSVETLVIFAVMMMFLVTGGSMIACLKRPEAWLATLIFDDINIWPHCAIFSGTAICADHCGAHDHSVDVAAA